MSGAVHTSAGVARWRSASVDAQPAQDGVDRIGGIARSARSPVDERGAARSLIPGGDGADATLRGDDIWSWNDAS
jgi:hypothetical protein